MKRTLFLCLVVLLLSVLFISCTSSVGLDEFNLYKADTEETIQTLVMEIDSTEMKINALQAKSDLLLSENNSLKEEITSIKGTFSNTYDQINELVTLAGYSSGEDFLNLAKDIVSVNTNIKQLNEKIEVLRKAMAAFVNN